MYSEADVGLEHLYFQFGADGSKLARYGNVRLLFMPATDHNLTPLPARKRLFDEIYALASRAAPAGAGPDEARREAKTKVGVEAA